MWHTAAYSASIAQNSLLTLTPATEPVLIQLSGGYVIPPDLPNLIYAHANGATIVACQIQAPSLRRLFLLDLVPLNKSANPTPPFRVYNRAETPWPFVPNEAVSVFANQASAGAERENAFLYFADRAPMPVTAPMLSVRCTGATTLTANAWTLVPLTFTQTLPAGLYSIVGMSATSATGLCARVVYVGGKYRPGVPATATFGDMTDLNFRNGLMGEFGPHFPHNTLPQVEFWSTAADTTQEVYFDLIKVG